MSLNSPTIATVYREEFIASFEQRTSYLRDTVSTEGLVKGESATFLLVGKADLMRQRGVDGLIPNVNEIDTQIKIGLKEMHHKTQQTSFDIFQAHGDRRRLMQERGMIAVNKEIDDTIINSLNSATTSYPLTLVGPATTIVAGTAAMSLNRLVDIMSDLHEKEIENDGMLTFVWTPKAYAAIQLLPQFTSADYVDEKPLVNGQRPFRFLGARHLIHNRLPGAGTNAATCFVYHKNSVGHITDTGGIKTDIGYNGEHDYSYARHSVWHGAGVLRQEGVMKIVFNDNSTL